MTWLDVTNYIAEVNQKLYPEIYGSPEKFCNFFHIYYFLRFSIITKY